MGAEAYFTTSDDVWFSPTDHARGPWAADACHAGPPAALLVRAMERLRPDHRLARITVEVTRPIPVSGFRVQAEVRRSGRSVSVFGASVLDEDRIYATASGLAVRSAPMAVATTSVEVPDFRMARPGPFAIRDALHDLPQITESFEARYDPSGSQGVGGPTITWLRTTVPVVEGEEPSGFQRICALADSANGISYNEYVDRVLFLNADLTIALHREPSGEWMGADVRSMWEPDGTGMSDAFLFDRTGPVGRSIQTLLLEPAPGRTPMNPPTSASPHG